MSDKLTIQQNSNKNEHRSRHPTWCKFQIHRHATKRNQSYKSIMFHRSKLASQHANGSMELCHKYSAIEMREFSSKQITQMADKTNRKVLETIKGSKPPTQQLGGHSPLRERRNSVVRVGAGRCLLAPSSCTISSWLVLLVCLLPLRLALSNRSDRMVRLCIASVDPVKLSSQCVMCNRREFPLTVIDCTGITKVNDLIANPLSVQEAKCLIYNCRRQVPQIRPEPYHGSANNAANYRGASTTLGSNYHQQRQLQGFSGTQLSAAVPPIGLAPPPLHAPFNSLTSDSRLYELMTPPGLFAPKYNTNSSPNQNYLQAPFMNRYGYPTSQSSYLDGGYSAPTAASSHSYAPAASMNLPRGLIGGPNLMSTMGQQALPYALVPAPSTGLLPFGSRKYGAALVPLFK